MPALVDSFEGDRLGGRRPGSRLDQDGWPQRRLEGPQHSDPTQSVCDCGMMTQIDVNVKNSYIVVLSLYILCECLHKHMQEACL